MTNELQSFLNKYSHHLYNLCKVDCNIFDVNLKEITGEHFYCRKCDLCDYINTHKYGCYEAQRWSGKYIYYCPAGFIFIAVVVMGELNKIDAGILAGPIIMGNIEDCEFDSSLNTDNVPNKEASVVNDLSEIMASLFIKGKNNNAEYETLLNDIYKIKDLYKDNDNYPIELEKQLISAIAGGDAALSKELINKLLGYAFFSSNGDFKIIKTRVLELVVLLSRAAIDGGADAEQIFILNKNYMEEVEDFKSIDQLSIWLTQVINRFISYVFYFKDIKHYDVIHKAIYYIKQNFNNKITLEEIADYVHISKSYLSKIFNDEMNCTLTNYINKIKVEKSKNMLMDNSLSLADIAYMVGFEDQSYYTKVFKKIVGVSPGKFKNMR